MQKETKRYEGEQSGINMRVKKGIKLSKELVFFKNCEFYCELLHTYRYILVYILLEVTKSKSGFFFRIAVTDFVHLVFTFRIFPFFLVLIWIRYYLLQLQIKKNLIVVRLFGSVIYSKV